MVSDAELKSYRQSRRAGAAALCAIFILIVLMVYQELDMKNKFDHLEYNQRILISEIDRYIPEVARLLDDDKLVFNNQTVIQDQIVEMKKELDEIKQLWNEHVHGARAKNLRPK